MNYQSISDIYAGNAKVRARLMELLATLTPDQLAALPEGEKWNVRQIIEHVSIVDENTMKICAKLLKKAQEAGVTSDGSLAISDNFVQKGKEIGGIKVEAPSFVQPTGERSIEESIAKLNATTERLEEMRGLFETVGCGEFKFPHPFFGEISAQEWLALKGGHEMRHVKQIERIVERLK